MRSVRNIDRYRGNRVIFALCGTRRRTQAVSKSTVSAPTKVRSAATRHAVRLGSCRSTSDLRRRIMIGASVWPTFSSPV